jgi:ABC-2 type transport system permease protein
VDLNIAHPVWMLTFLLLTCISFSLFGFIIGLWANDFEKLQVIPLLVITPLVFLGGSFYSVSMLPPFWQTVTLFNPVVYLISGFRWSFFEVSDVSVGVSLAMVPKVIATDFKVQFGLHYSNPVSEKRASAG